MSNCINYNCDDALGDHLLNDCQVELQAGIDAVIILECDHQLTDPSNGTLVQAEIDAGRATLIENVKVGIGEPSPVEIDSAIAGRDSKLVKYTTEGTYVNSNVNDDNMDFHNRLFSNRSFGGMIVRLVEEGKVLWIDEEINFKGGLPVADSNGEFIAYRGTFMHDSKPNEVVPNLYTEPSNIFGQ